VIAQTEREQADRRTVDRMSEQVASGAPRTLAEELRGRADDDLVALLRARPDLTSPVPNDVGQLAARLTTRPSVARALDRLDRAALATVEALALLDEPTDVAHVAALLGWSTDTAGAQVGRLRRMALVWGPHQDLRLVRAAREILGVQIAGLGPPARAVLAALPPDRLGTVAADVGVPPSRDPLAMAARVADRLADPAWLEQALAAAGPEARTVAARLAQGPPTGRVDQALRPVTLAKARSPVDRLLARGLVVATDSSTVVLPREVGLHLRNGRLYPAGLDRPQPHEQVHDVTLIDRLGAGTAADLVRAVEIVAEAWGDDPPAVLRAGGLGVRELRRTAALLDGDVATTVRVVEIAYVAGLVAPDGSESEWLPTSAFDTWLRSEPAARWVALVEAWLSSSRLPALAIPREGRDKPPAPLSADLDRPGAPELRGLTLGLLASLPAGHGLAVDDVLDLVRWHRPRRSGPARDALARWTLDEASAYGLLARGAVTSAARLLFVGDLSGAERAMDALLPRPLDHVLLQADLTAIAPGPLEPPLAREMALVATVESTGGATVYRFTEASVRRGLDAGRSAADIHHFLATVSLTPVPQPLTYLVDDVARRHGRVRVGTAAALVTCEDPAVLDEIMADARFAALAPRRVAPTVATAHASPSAVLDLLASIGMHPSVDGADGGLAVPNRRHRTAARGKPRALRADRPAPSEATLSAAVRAIRAGDRGVQSRPVETPPALGHTASTDVLQSLAAAIQSGASVWLGYVDNHGTTTERIVDPVSLDAGWLSAFDHRTEQVRTFAVHRISAVAPLPASREPATPA
jgi:hypothetical protein